MKTLPIKTLTAGHGHATIIKRDSVQQTVRVGACNYKPTVVVFLYMIRFELLSVCILCRYMADDIMRSVVNQRLNSGRVRTVLTRALGVCFFISLTVNRWATAIYTVPWLGLPDCCILNMGDFFVLTSTYYSQCLSGAYGRGFMGDMPLKLLEIFFRNIV